MANKFKSGSAIPFHCDTTLLGSLDSVQFRVYNPNNNQTKAKYAYPITEGFGTVAKDGNVYSFTVSATESASMIGVWQVEMAYVQAGGDTLKTIDSGILEIEQSASS